MLCSVSEVKTIVSPESVTDDDILAIITHTSAEISLETGASTESTEPALNIACVHLSAATVLERMKYTGELAKQVKLGSEQQSNDVDADIRMHREKATSYINRYKHRTFSIPYGRSGIRTVNSEE